MLRGNAKVRFILGIGILIHDATTMDVRQGTGGKLTSGSEGTFSPGLKVYLEMLFGLLVGSLAGHLPKPPNQCLVHFRYNKGFSFKKNMQENAPKRLRTRGLEKMTTPMARGLMLHRTVSAASFSSYRQCFEWSNHSQLDFTGHWLNWCPAF